MCIKGKSRIHMILQACIRNFVYINKTICIQKESSWYIIL